jgi:surface polysaccharide O-acyltransferase-like enzyme
VTIVIIVAGHSYGIAGWNIESFWDRLLANLLSGGTSLFVFISGFLFHHVFFPRYDYVTFVRKKFKNVYVPYLFLSIIPVCISIYTRIPYEEFYFGQNDTFYDQIVRPAFLYYWYGGVMAYWYIPFIMCMFLISPLFVWFVRQSTKYKIIIICILSIISVFIHRPVNNWSVLQSVVYFSPVYMFGILCSMKRDWIYKKLEGKDCILFAAVILLAVLQAIVMDTCGNLQKNPFEYNGVDISYFQKLCLCVFFMVFLRRFEYKEYTLLKQLAASSFSIYFLHGWFVYLFWMTSSYYENYFGLHMLPVLTILIVWFSYNFALFFKKFFPNKSRMIIGW